MYSRTCIKRRCFKKKKKKGGKKGGREREREGGKKGEDVSVEIGECTCGFGERGKDK